MPRESRWGHSAERVTQECQDLPRTKGTADTNTSSIMAVAMMLLVFVLSCTADPSVETDEDADTRLGATPTNTTAETENFTAEVAAPKLNTTPTTPGIASTTQARHTSSAQVDSAAGIAAPQDVPMWDFFVDMWDWEEGEDHMVENAGFVGTLVIEAPCAYVLTDDPSHRWLLSLLRRATRYEPQTGSLWIWQSGPFFSGDEVVVGGGGHDGTGLASDLALTLCNFDHTWTTHAMSPWDPKPKSPLP